MKDIIKLVLAIVTSYMAVGLIGCIIIEVLGLNIENISIFTLFLIAIISGFIVSRLLRLIACNLKKNNNLEDDASANNF